MNLAAHDFFQPFFKPDAADVQRGFGLVAFLAGQDDVAPIVFAAVRSRFDVVARELGYWNQVLTPKASALL